MTAINRNFKRSGPVPRPVDSCAYSTPEQEQEAVRRKQLYPGNHKPKEKLTVYRVSDGLEVNFQHHVDMVQALLTGRFVKDLAVLKEAPAEVTEEPDQISKDGNEIVIDGVEKLEN